jgi:hypothetical protein
MVAWWKPILLTFILGGIGGFFAYSFANRPIVDYYIDSPPTVVNFQYTNLTLRLCARNTGSLYAPVDMLITLQNASMLRNGESYINSSANETTIHYKLEGNMANYDTETIEVCLADNSDSFSISYSVVKRSELSWTGITNIFAELNPYGSVSLIYNRTDGNSFRLLS